MFTRQHGVFGTSTIQMALVTGCFIAAYSLDDGHGARQAGLALGYFGWLAIVNTMVFATIAAIRQPGFFGKLVGTTLKTAILGGGASFVAYRLVVWASLWLPSPWLQRFGKPASFLRY